MGKMKMTSTRAMSSIEMINISDFLIWETLGGMIQLTRVSDTSNDLGMREHKYFGVLMPGP